MVTDSMSTGFEPVIPWWLVLLQGIASALLGLLLVTETGITLFTLVVFLGIYWLVSGVFDLVSLFMDRSMWGWKLFTGILGIVAGLVVVRHPFWSGVVLGTTLVWILAFLGIIIGVATIVRAFMGAGWGAGILGALSLVLGLILLFRPLTSALVLAYIVAAWLLVGGVMAIVGSFSLKSAQDALRAGRSPQAMA